MATATVAPAAGGEQGLSAAAGSNNTAAAAGESPVTIDTDRTPAAPQLVTAGDAAHVAAFDSHSTAAAAAAAAALGPKGVVARGFIGFTGLPG
jgi:hypothetical protein